MDLGDLEAASREGRSARSPAAVSRYDNVVGQQFVYDITVVTTGFGRSPAWFGCGRRGRLATL
jgi:hypothetical protein